MILNYDLDRAASEIEKSQIDWIKSWAWVEMAKAYQVTGDVDKAKAALDKSLEVAKTLENELMKVQILIHLCEGFALVQQNDIFEASR